MKEFLKANKGCVLAIVLISPVVVAFFEYIFYYHVQYRTENVKCVYDIIGAGLQTCLYQMAVIFIPFTMVYFFKGCYRYGIIIRQTQLKQVWPPYSSTTMTMWAFSRWRMRSSSEILVLPVV